MGKCKIIRSLLDIPVGEPEQRKIEVKRLGLVLTVKELPYNTLTKLMGEQDADLHFILTSTVSPDFRDPAWYSDHMGCPTPIDAMKKLFRAGEIRGIAKVLDKLNGYGATVADVTGREQAAMKAAVEDLEKN